MKPKTHDIELRPDEFAALIHNEMIMSMCDEMLATPRKRSGYAVLRLTEAQLEDLAGWVAAEANHAKTRDQAETLGEVCEQLEAVLAASKMSKPHKSVSHD
jgi:hypothetical protein